MLAISACAVLTNQNGISATPKLRSKQTEIFIRVASTCGLALSAGDRVVVADIETCDLMAGTADLDEYRRSNIRAVQSTPLISRSGQLLGMIFSTHWRQPHHPTERALHRLDVLARQAADLIERSRTEAALRESNEQLLQLASIVESSDDSIITKSLDGIIRSWNRSAERLFGSELLTPLLAANPFSTMRALLWRCSSEEFEDGVTHGGQSGLRRRPRSTRSGG